MAQKVKVKKGKVEETRDPTGAGDDVPKPKERTPEGWQSLWKKEMEAADREAAPFLRQAREVEKVYTDSRTDSELSSDKRTNQFTADVIDTECLLYGRTPQTDVSRKFQDADDNVARVAALMMERLLNGDIERPDDKFARVAGYALSDHLRTNFGLIRWRYDHEMKKVPAKPAVMRPGPDGVPREVVPAVEAHDEVSWEDAVAEYCHWRDVRWSPCRIWEDVRWVSFDVPMRRDELTNRFGKEGRRVALNSKRYREEGSDEDNPRSPWDRATVREIWSKEHAKVFWYVEGHDRILDMQPDPLQLADFWPCPRPLVAWITTTRFMPKPEYLIAQDLYRAVERLTFRIDMLTEALRVVGVFDENFKELQQLMDSTEENIMVPVANWNSVVAERGGMEGVISWMPLEQTIKALEQLVLQRQQEQELLERITGRADVQRGALTNPGETATATRSKVKFASKRIQRKQDMFAEFVSDAQRIRAEIILKLFSDDTIKARANVNYLDQDDQQCVDEALKLLREDGIDGFRISVKSEALALPDYAEMQQDGTEFMNAMSTMIGSMVKLPPVAMPILPELATALKWYASKFKGATEIESAMDRMAKKLQKLADQPPQQPGQDDSKVQAQALKNQGDQQRIQLEAKNRSQELQEETQAELAKQKAQLDADLQLKAFELEHKAAADAASDQRDIQKDAQHHQQELQQVEVQEQHEMRAGAMESQRQEQQEQRTHERQLQAEQVKQKGATQQLREKGKQAMQAAKVKAKAQPKGGKK